MTLSVSLNGFSWNHSMAEVAVNGSSYVIVASPLSVSVALSLYSQILGPPVFLSFCSDFEM